VSLRSDGGQGKLDSFDPSMSATGRFVVFVSQGRLVPQDTIVRSPDVYLRDVQSNTISLVTKAPDGSPANRASFEPTISADGSVVAFASFASNLVRNDPNGDAEDVFVYDVATGTTRMVSRVPDPENLKPFSEHPSLSADGRYVGFASVTPTLVSGDTNDVEDVFVRDRVLGVTERVSVNTRGTQANGASEGAPSISADGRFVTFESLASNLVSGDTNGSVDVFVRDRSLGVTRLVSRGLGGVVGDGPSQAPAISANGQYVSFSSSAANLVTGDANHHEDVFVRDLVNGVTDLVSVGAGEVQGDSLSFDSALSGSGRYVVFRSLATNLVSGDTNAVADVFVRDRVAGATLRVSVGVGDVQANGSSGFLGLAISANGQHVAFDSFASNLVTGDTNERDDVFVRQHFAGGGA